MTRTVEVWTNDPEKKMTVLIVSLTIKKKEEIESGSINKDVK